MDYITPFVTQIELLVWSLLWFVQFAAQKRRSKS